MRQLECELALLQKPDGSALFQQGDTKVTSGVYGPAEVKVSKELIDRSYLECILKPKSGMSGVKEKALEEFMTHACRDILLSALHPRSAVQIVMQIMHNDGSLLSTLLNAACMSMVHAGLPMRCMLVAVCCVISKDDQYIVDPTAEQEVGARCTFTLSFESKNINLISSHTTGRFTIEEYFKCLQLSRESAKQVFEFQRSSIHRFLSRDVEETNEEINSVNEEERSEE
ncbi:exosome complex component RRP46-like [Hydractinia symbiolongicarpus]|uniref:exosome complex component RRP46-like n=1 Tax=Hydractinia symbiolongicarpus TaxID=13093 RepID=UPI00254AF5D0|nr:exosome complex component RRP46-like [Hydractinia symbiolongicarpus]